MKKCPVCGAMSFDDAPLCYGCLHDYSKRDPKTPEGGDAGAGAAEAPSPAVSGEGGPFAEERHVRGQNLVLRMSAPAPRAYTVEARPDGSLRLTFSPGWSCSVMEGAHA